MNSPLNVYQPKPTTSKAEREYMALAFTTGNAEEISSQQLLWNAHSNVTDQICHYLREKGCPILRCPYESPYTCALYIPWAEPDNAAPALWNERLREASIDTRKNTCIPIVVTWRAWDGDEWGEIQVNETDLDQTSVVIVHLEGVKHACAVVPPDWQDRDGRSRFDDIGDDMRNAQEWPFVMHMSKLPEAIANILECVKTGKTYQVPGTGRRIDGWRIMTTSTTEVTRTYQSPPVKALQVTRTSNVVNDDDAIMQGSEALQNLRLQDI